MKLSRRRLLGGALAAPLVAAGLPALLELDQLFPPQALTHVPDWGGSFNASLLMDCRPDDRAFKIVHEALERAMGKSGYKIVGTNVGKRYDLPGAPWQLYVEATKDA